MEWIIGGLNLPLPDAKPDKRIYELLKTVDLENLTFADFQGVAKTIYAEQGAEDELRRIILVNLARLSVKGEWNGLTSAGGGGSGAGVSFPQDDIATNYDQWNITNSPPYYGGDNSYTASGISAYQIYCPFIAPKSGDISEMGIVQGSTVPSGSHELYGAIYNTDSNNMPDALQGYATFDITVGGTQYQTSFSSTITLEKDKLYWFAFSRNTTTAATFEFWQQRPPRFAPSNAPAGFNVLLSNEVSTSTPPSSAPASSALYTISHNVLCVSVVIS